MSNISEVFGRIEIDRLFRKYQNERPGDAFRQTDIPKQLQVADVFVKKLIVTEIKNFIRTASGDTVSLSKEDFEEDETELSLYKYHYVRPYPMEMIVDSGMLSDLVPLLRNKHTQFEVVEVFKEICKVEEYRKAVVGIGLSEGLVQLLGQFSSVARVIHDMCRNVYLLDELITAGLLTKIQNITTDISYILLEVVTHGQMLHLSAILNTNLLQMLIRHMMENKVIQAVLLVMSVRIGNNGFKARLNQEYELKTRKLINVYRTGIHALIFYNTSTYVMQVSRNMSVATLEELIQSVIRKQHSIYDMISTEVKLKTLSNLCSNSFNRSYISRHEELVRYLVETIKQATTELLHISLHLLNNMDPRELPVEIKHDEEFMGYLLYLSNQFVYPLTYTEANKVSFAASSVLHILGHGNLYNLSAHKIYNMAYQRAH